MTNRQRGRQATKHSNEAALLNKLLLYLVVLVVMGMKVVEVVAAI